MVMPWETFAKGEAEDKTDAEEADDELVDLDSLENDEDALSDLKKMDGISEDKE